MQTIAVVAVPSVVTTANDLGPPPPGMADPVQVGDGHVACASMMPSASGGGVGEAVGVDVPAPGVGVTVAVLVRVAVGVIVEVGVRVGVFVGVAVLVGVAVGVSVGVSGAEQVPKLPPTQYAFWYVEKLASLMNPPSVSQSD